VIATYLKIKAFLLVKYDIYLLYEIKIINKIITM